MRFKPGIFEVKSSYQTWVVSEGWILPMHEVFPLVFFPLEPSQVAYLTWILFGSGKGFDPLMVHIACARVPGT